MGGITRWSPHSCGCSFEMEYDEQLKDNKFLLVNRLCPKHKPLASTKHKDNHSQLSNHVIDLIEEAKHVNITNHNNAIEAAESQYHKNQLIRLTANILQFNANITEEWNELVTRTWAFDSHIYDQVMKENHSND